MRPRTSRALSRAVFAPVFVSLVVAASLLFAMPARAERLESPLELMYGDDAVIVQGASAESNTTATLQKKALYSTVHGAGRVMSRSAAAGKINRRNGKVIRPGAVSPQMMQSWVREKGVILRGGGLDESPHVYRRLPEVIAAQRGTVDVLHTLRPLIVVMAGADLFDPYKD